MGWSRVRLFWAHPFVGGPGEKVGHCSPSPSVLILAPHCLPQVPYFIPDTPAARADLAAQYTTIGRMDQGGLAEWGTERGATAWVPNLGQRPLSQITAGCG